MDRLFTPWRHAYVTGSGKGPGCVLCRAVEEAARPESLVLYLSALNVVVMNLYPYNGGHLMVAPRRHVGTLGEAAPEELADMPIYVCECGLMVAWPDTPDFTTGDDTADF